MEGSAPLEVASRIFCSVPESITVDWLLIRVEQLLNIPQISKTGAMILSRFVWLITFTHHSLIRGKGINWFVARILNAICLLLIITQSQIKIDMDNAPYSRLFLIIFGYGIIKIERNHPPQYTHCEYHSGVEIASI